jgi:hypothetical protein
MTDPNTSSTPIFRTVEVGPDVPVTLGEPLSDPAKGLMHKVGPQHFKLDPGTYANAETIDVHLTAHALVHRMDFTYAAGSDYAEMVARYEADLGPPTSRSGQVTLWKDATTEFKLENSSTGISSALRDLSHAQEHP